MSTQGTEANASGDFLQSALENIFKGLGVPIFNYSDNSNNGDLLAPRFVLRGVPYTNKFKCVSRNGLVYRRYTEAADVRLVPRWQETPGTADEKLMFAYCNARDNMPENEIWFVIDGGGARPGALDWMRQAIDKTTVKAMRMMNLAEARQNIRTLVSASSASRRPPKKAA